MIKKITSTIGLLALTASSYAGEPVSAKAIIPPAPEPSRLDWFVGTSAGYLLDKDEPIYALQFGVQKQIDGTACSHALYLELGYSEYEERTTGSVDSNPLDFDVDTEIIPLTLNYRYECAINDKVSWYAGLGGGVAFIDADTDFTNDSDTVFFAQAFAGIFYKINPNLKASFGVAYVYMDDPSFSAPELTVAISPERGVAEIEPISESPSFSSATEDAASADGDFIISLGLTYTF